MTAYESLAQAVRSNDPTCEIETMNGHKSIFNKQQTSAQGVGNAEAETSMSEFTAATLLIATVIETADRTMRRPKVRYAELRELIGLGVKTLAIDLLGFRCLAPSTWRLARLCTNAFSRC